MPDSEPSQLSLVKWISGASAATLLAVAVVTNVAGVWVSGKLYEEVKVERNEWKKLALDGLKTAESASKVRLSLPLDPNEATPGEVGSRLRDIESVIQE